MASSFMPLRLLDRYVLRELLVPFLIGTFTFVIIMLGDVARQLGSAFLGSNVSLLLIARYLLCNAPHALSWSLPVGTVVGVAMAITIMSNNGEITAMRAGGASFRRICRSIILVGIVGSIISFVFGECIAPTASKAARDVFVQIGLNQPIVEDAYNVFFRDETGSRIFYVRHLNPVSNELEDVSIWQHDQTGHIISITAAKWAEVKGNVWYLREGSTVWLNQFGAQEGPVDRFGKREVKLRAALQDYYASRKTPFEMSAAELSDMISTLRPAGEDTQKLQVQYHFKYSIPLGCLVFALIAAPISFRFARHGSFVGIVIAVLVIFLYNGVRSWTLAFGLAGSLNPVLAGWLPDAIFGGLGVYLLGITR